MKEIIITDKTNKITHYLNADIEINDKSINVIEYYYDEDKVEFLPYCTHMYEKEFVQAINIIC